MQNADILRKHLEAYVANDWTTYKSFLTDDAIYDEEATRRVVKGPDEIVKAVQIWKRAFPDLKVTIKNAFTTGDAVVAEIEWEGTHKGPLEGPMGSIPASGRRGKVAAVEVVRFDGGKIREMRHYFDLMTVLNQVGLSMRPAAAPAP